MLRFAISGLLVCACLSAEQRFAATGLVVAVEPASTTITISHSAIPNFMDAMTMPFRADRIPTGLKAGDSVAFTLMVDDRKSSIRDVHLLPFESGERDPAAASRLAILDSALGKKSLPVPLQVGRKVPDFALTAQDGSRVTLAQFAGKVVALDFVYTRCPLPEYCFRLSTNFSRLAKRFAKQTDLQLLTVSFDPVHDTPQALAKYAKIWNTNGAAWKFLTGAPADVERVCGLFGVAFWNDDGFFTHTLHTAVIDRQGRLAANLEGNRFTAQQLGDLVDATLRRK